MSILLTGGLSELTNALAEQLVDTTNLIILHNYNSDANEEAILGILLKENVKKVFDCSLTTNSAVGDPLKSAPSILLGITGVVDAIRNYGLVQCFTLVSGEQVYGNSSNRVETQPLEPVTFVGSAMMSVEAMVHSYAMSYRIPTVIGRIPEGNKLPIAQVASGLLAISNSIDFSKPAEVYNITTDETGAKIRNTFGWSPTESAISSAFCDVRPKLLIFGDSPVKREFVVKTIADIPYVESTISSKAFSNDDVHREILKHSPSHILYFSTSREAFDGDSFILRENMSTNLYLPWLLAAESDKMRLHFTYFGTGELFGIGDDEEHDDDEMPTLVEKPARAVKKHTDKMLRRFETTLQCRMGLPIGGMANEPTSEKLRVAANELDELDTSVSNLNDCLPRVLQLILAKRTGIFNVVNPGTIKIKELKSRLPSTGPSELSILPLVPVKMSCKKFEASTSPLPEIRQILH
ncbi:unnamed protein product [Caenorhabditis bovis]|uniref:NAD-dependent epimerase/dehydratase domain-containing protein n=1 Tax=Caenorhabditis bovis TaxID=2654633 RepID=A0A8S1F8S2_9PELO|nr:unnamed protein product [Caenorhabditis bovis]